jgi:hypothetical protein
MFFLAWFGNPLVRKIAIYVAIAAGALLLLRWYSNRSYYQGVDAGVKLEADRLVKAKAAEWKLREDAIAAQAKQVAEQEKTLEAMRAKLVGMRSDLDRTLAEIKARGDAAGVSAGVIVASVPASELDNALRLKSNELANIVVPPVPASTPLSETTTRQVLLQLYELSSSRDKIASYEGFIEKDRALDERESSLFRQTLENEKRATDLSNKERDLALEQAKFWEDLYKTTTKKKGGIGCTLKKIFTLGIVRCQ